MKRLLLLASLVVFTSCSKEQPTEEVVARPLQVAGGRIIYELPIGTDVSDNTKFRRVFVVSEEFWKKQKTINLLEERCPVTADQAYKLCLAFLKKQDSVDRDFLVKMELLNLEKTERQNVYIGKLGYLVEISREYTGGSGLAILLVLFDGTVIPITEIKT